MSYVRYFIATIYYKDGVTVTAKVKEFHLTRKNGEVKVEWVSHGRAVLALHNVQDIVAVCLEPRIF